MVELSLDTIDETISKEAATSAWIEKANYDNCVYNNSARHRVKMFREAKEFLELGHKVAEHPQGIKVNNKFILGAKTEKWRVDGKSKWYWYSRESFIKILENR
jgi:hypothetical protein